MLNTPGDCVQRLSVFIPELITQKSKIKLIFKTPPQKKKKKTKTKQKEKSQKTTATIIFRLSFLHPKIGKYILLNVLQTFPLVVMRRVFLTILSIFCWDPLSFMLVTLMFDLEVIQLWEFI